MAASPKPSFPNIESAPASYLVCEVRDAGLTVSSNLDVVRRLQIEVMEAFKALPKRGMEIGGLLLGRTEDDGRLVIEDFEPIPSEHRRGPAYLLSEKDKRLFGERILHWQSAGALDVIGLFRSNTRAGLAPSEEDIALLAEHPQGVFLLVQPASGKASTATLFMGERLVDRGFDFPFHPSGFTSGRFQVAQASAPVRPTAPAESPSATKPSPILALPPEAAPGSAASASIVDEKEGRTVRRTPKPISLIWLAAVAAVAVLATGMLWLRMWHSGSRGPEARLAPIGLTVAWSDGSLHLRWNRNSPLIPRAKRGVVWIVDGQRRQLMLLDSRQLNQGSIQYWPDGREVEFQLQLVTDGYRASESVTAVQIPVPTSSGPEALTPNVLAGALVSTEPHGPPINSAKRPPIASTPVR